MRNYKQVPGFIVPLIAILASILPSQAYAYDFEADGIYYTTISDSEAAVTSPNQSSYSGNVIIPEIVRYGDSTYSVTSIGENAFYYCSSLSSVEIPNSVTSIGDWAFADCSSLTSVEIPYSVTSIGNYAFYECSSLASVEIPNSVTSIGNSAFYYCISITSIEIPNSVTFIGGRAFKSCISLEQIIVDPENPNYSSIGGVLYNKDLTSLLEASSALKGDFIIPNTVISIGDSAFESCSSLTSVEIPYTVTSIGDSAFFGCISLSSVEIPSSVTSIGDSAFYGCWSITSIEIPNSVTSIGNYAFESCSSLMSIEIPNSVISIGDHAFYGCWSITSIEIPNSVTSIGDCAFCDCISLKTVISLSTTPARLGTNAFINTSATLLVPESALQSYRLSDWNKYFSNRMEALQIPVLNVETRGNGKIYSNGLPVSYTATFDQDGNMTLFILADDGNRIAYAYLDGEDVTDRIVNHLLEIKGHKKSGTLKIVFEPEMEASLTVKGANSHSLTHYYMEGTRARIDLIPEDGWTLYSLSFNGEDVTESVSGGSYTTPALTGNNELVIVMNSDSTSEVDKVEMAQRRISFRKAGNTVEILNLEEGETISIFNAEGRCEYHGNHHTVSLDSNNVYILRTRRETLKFSL